MRRLASELHNAGGLRDDPSTEEAGDILWATNSPELYALLVTERCWTPAHYQTSLADTRVRIFLPGI